MKKSVLSIALIILLITKITIAQDDKKSPSIEELQQLSIEELLNINIDLQITKKTGDDIFQTPSTVTIINKEQIAEYNFQTLAEALNSVAGITVIRTYLKKDLPTLRGILQDHYANKVLLMINGIPTWNASTGEGIYSRVSIEDVERIEILKGPASVQYGTNAYSGAINVILKNDRKPGVESHAGVGSKNDLTVGSNVNANWKSMHLFVSANSLNINNPETAFKDSEGGDGFVNDFTHIRNFTLSGNYRNYSVLINSYQSNEGYYGVLPRYSAGAGSNHLCEGSLLGFTGKNVFFEKLILNEGIYLDYNKRDLSRTKGDSIRSEIIAHRLGAFITGFYNFSEIFSLEVGGDMDSRHSSRYSNYILQTDSIIAENNMKNRKLNEYSAYMQLYLRTKKVSATVGSRLTHNDKFGTNMSYRASLGYSITPKNTVKFIYGSSYRVPSLFELYFENPQRTVYGNVNLKPEKANSFELVFLSSFNRFFLQLLGYHAYYTDKIQRTERSINQNLPSPSVEREYNNVGKFNAYGVEAEFKYSNPKIINGFINYNYMQGTKGDTLLNNQHYNFKYVPLHTLTGGLSKQFLRIVNISAVYTFYSSMGSVFSTIEPQHIFDLNLSIGQSFKNLKLTHIISVKNITDTKVVFPDYTSREVNEIPYGISRAFMYSLKITIE